MAVSKGLRTKACAMPDASCRRVVVVAAAAKAVQGGPYT
jgi:hypothetical protein